MRLDRDSRQFLAGVQLTILHLVGMLLIVAVGSNYALFFDRQRHELISLFNR